MPRKVPKPKPADDVYEIKQILDYERRNGKDYYLVEWDGYPIEDATWEPEENFFDPTPDIQKRLKELKSAASKNVRSSLKRKQRRNSSAPQESCKKTRVADSENSEDDKHGASDPSTCPHFTTTSPVSPSIFTEFVTPRATTPRATTPKLTTPKLTTPKLTTPKVTTSKSQGDNVVEPSKSLKNTNTRKRVKSIRQDSNKQFVVIITDGMSEYRRTMSEARVEIPDELIEFLISRIQFKSAESG